MAISQRRPLRGYLYVMAQIDQIEPPGAAKVLKGLAGELALTLRARAAAFMAEAADPKALDRDMRALALIARAAISVQGMQAAEDKADARALEAAGKRALARVHAQNRNPDEGDETDMNEPDPRLKDPKLMAEADKELARRLDAFALEIKTQTLPRQPAGRAAPRGARQLADAEPPVPTPAH